MGRIVREVPGAWLTVREECGAQIRLGFGKGIKCGRPKGHPTFSVDGVGHNGNPTWPDQQVLIGKCPLPRPRPTDMPGHFMICERNGRTYVLQEGALGQDEYMGQWRLMPWGWVPWDDPIYEWFGFPGAR